jgi:hypothetical protein
VRPTFAPLRRRSGPRSLHLLTVGAVAAVPGSAEAQLRWVDLVVTAGVSGEGYEGNLASATVPIIDSTDRAQAAVGEFGLQGRVMLLERPTSTILADLDLGIRQFAATGFEVRDYAPREAAGRASLFYRQRLGGFGTMELNGSFQTRSVEDRPPMPLFLQPGYQRLNGRARYILPSLQGVQFDVSGGVERSDYEAPRLFTQVDLLDRNALSVELGARWGVGLDVRFYTAFRETEYGSQPSFDPEQPFRRDRTITIGGQWTWTATVGGSVSVEGVVNRSNSRRPEYDAFVLRAELGAPLPLWDLSANVYGVFTGKSYVYSLPFARLVAGEEAENASLLYLELSRPVVLNLDAALRGGWTKAETEIGESYYERYGVSFVLRYRPILR